MQRLVGAIVEENARKTLWRRRQRLVHNNDLCICGRATAAARYNFIGGGNVRLDGKGLASHWNRADAIVNFKRISMLGCPRQGGRLTFVDFLGKPGCDIQGDRWFRFGVGQRIETSPAIIGLGLADNIYTSVPRIEDDKSTCRVGSDPELPSSSDSEIEIAPLSNPAIIRCCHPDMINRIVTAESE